MYQLEYTVSEFSSNMTFLKRTIAALFKPFFNTIYIDLLKKLYFNTKLNIVSKLKLSQNNFLCTSLYVTKTYPEKQTRDFTQPRLVFNVHCKHKNKQRVEIWYKCIQCLLLN